MHDRSFLDFDFASRERAFREAMIVRRFPSQIPANRGNRPPVQTEISKIRATRAFNEGALSEEYPRQIARGISPIMHAHVACGYFDRNVPVISDYGNHMYVGCIAKITDK